MEILKAIDVTYLNIPKLTLEQLEEKFIQSGLDEGSFCFFKIEFSDGIQQVWFDYPTDLNKDEALELANRILSQ